MLIAPHKTGSAMHSVLFVAKIPDHVQTWNTLLRDIRPMPGTDVLRLAENVWLLNLQQSVAPLGWLVARCEQHRVTYRMLPLGGEPQWLPADSDPSTTLAH